MTRRKEANRWGAKGALVLASAILAAIVPAPALAASVTVSGSVYCTSGAKVVGIFVQSSGGGSRFAERAPRGPTSALAVYRATVGAGKVELHVGCGGTPERWGSDQYTKPANVSRNRTLNTLCTGRSGAFTRRDGVRWCQWPKTARQVSGPNPVGERYRTQCTWLALEKWRAAVGAYPLWRPRSGPNNAENWNENAKANGWTVVGAPAPRSIVVFERGGLNRLPVPGHVAWVNSVTLKSDGWYVNVTHQNYRGTDGNLGPKTGTFKHGSGMSYIWAPL